MWTNGTGAVARGQQLRLQQIEDGATAAQGWPYGYFTANIRRVYAELLDL